MPDFVRAASGLTPSDLERMRAGLLASPLVGASTLAGSFRQSRGFAVTFQRGAAEQVRSRLPFAAPFFDRVLHPQIFRPLLPFFARPFARAPEANAFYLNLLVIADGGRVGRHVDATLREPSGVADAVPLLVTVLYLAVPARASGGELVLWRGDREVASLAPREGELVSFRGDLWHAVTPLEGANAPRVSLVLEQYRFEEAALARIPELLVQSKAGFGAYLEEHARRAHAARDPDPT